MSGVPYYNYWLEGRFRRFPRSLAFHLTPNIRHAQLTLQNQPQPPRASQAHDTRFTAHDSQHSPLVCQLECLRAGMHMKLVVHIDDVLLRRIR